jgi:hypothetical protein
MVSGDYRLSSALALTAVATAHLIQKNYPRKSPQAAYLREIGAGIIVAADCIRHAFVLGARPRSNPPKTWLANPDISRYWFLMSQIADLRKIAAELSTPERAEFAAFLLGTLEEPHHWEDDSEVRRRSEELDSGAVKGITREEFTRQCGH